MKKEQLQLDQNQFIDRHIGPQTNEIERMLKSLGAASLSRFVETVVPKKIQLKSYLNLDPPQSESVTLSELRNIAKLNENWRSYIGMGYSGTITPTVVKRNILENPGWYTQYTPYQAEISQGRLEALLNFQTMVIDLTGLPISNASLLDEATAAAEAMAMAYAIFKQKNPQSDCMNFFAAKNCHPQILAVLETRAEPLGINIIIGDPLQFSFSEKIFGFLVNYPASDGSIIDIQKLSNKVHDSGAFFIVSADLLSLTLLKPPGECGVDIAIGNTQRFGVPMGFGGPHAAYLSTRDEFKRLIPGRIIGLSQDADGRPAARLALQTREQHIRREKATSNICTAQVLLAIISSMYAVYHGPKGLRKVAEKIHALTNILVTGLKEQGHQVLTHQYFDTITVQIEQRHDTKIISELKQKQINLRNTSNNTFGISLDETVTLQDVKDILSCFGDISKFDEWIQNTNETTINQNYLRSSQYLTHPVFNRYHSETEILRYITRLESKDLSLTTSMIPLGSCTMKLNATSEMEAVTWREFAELHPFVPANQSRGYLKLFAQLESWLAEITGFDSISLQPNAGSQGEYAGLLVIRKFHLSRGDKNRNICLIPKSAHGTNPASAVMAGMKVIVVDCDTNGNVDMSDLKAKAKEHANELAAAMITYPSTHGVFEESIVEFCEVIHSYGGQVYMDGANMNAQVGLCRPGDFGPDVCHLNLHKTFCIPHGGGGPGMGPIGVKKHLAKFLPRHPVVQTQDKSDYTNQYDPKDVRSFNTVSASPWGSSSILPISWAYIRMMGGAGLKKASEVAILNANYIAQRLNSHFPVLYKGSEGLVAHECIVDLRDLKDKSGVDVEDVAKRLMDYGYHAPTISFPVPGTMMIEPTESESLSEIDRFCEAMISIRNEIQEIIDGKADRQQNVLKNAPHPAERLLKTEWTMPYSREKAAFPAPWLRQNKFWTPVSRINQALGDRNLICSCPPIDSY